MQPIHVQRYAPEMKKAGWLGTISPEDGRWIVFVDVDHEPHLWVLDTEVTDENGDKVQHYVPRED